VIGAALQLGLAFNLICSGTMRTGPIGLALPEQDGEPFTIVYRIDVDGRRWCSDDCGDVEQMDSIVGGQIVLRDQHDSDGSDVITIFPAARRFTDTEIAGNTATLRSGTCDAGPFTGFPTSIA
jgi:hypothetical protein